MSKFSAMPRFTPPLQFVGGRGVKTTLVAAVAAIAIAAALLGGSLHSQAHADSPTSTGDTRALQPHGDASQTLRRYTLQLLHILSNPDANQWERYRQAMPHCAAAPKRLGEISAAGDVGPLDATLIALTEDLCADLDLRLDDARTVGLLVNEPEAMRGYILLTGGFNNNVHLIDHLGRIAHSWQVGNQIPHARLLDNGNLLVELEDEKRSITEVDPDSNIVWQYAHPDDTHHHDFLKMPDGNVLMLMRGVKTTEEAVAAGANPDLIPSGGMEYDYLIEVRPTGSEGGEIVWEWSAWDYLVQDFDVSKPNYQMIAERPELIDANFGAARHWRNPIALAWTYINAIDYNPQLDQILLSARHFSELWIIDHSAATEEAAARSNANPGNGNTPPHTDVLHNGSNGNAGKGGALLYRWGNPRAYAHGMPADRRLFLQHHTQWIEPGLPGAGNILIFNNGWAYQRDQSRNYSSIEEIVPPVDGYGYRREPRAAYPPAEPIWSYTAETPTDFYASIVSGVQRLPNGNTLICEGTSGNVFEVTPDGKTVWQYVYPMDAHAPLKQGEEASLSVHGKLPGGDNLFNNAVYRAYWYAPDHPGLQKYDLTPRDTIELYE